MVECGNHLAVSFQFEDMASSTDEVELIMLRQVKESSSLRIDMSILEMKVEL